MPIINILAKLPNDIKNRIDEPKALRINNDKPGLYIPLEYSKELNEIIDSIDSDLSEKQTNLLKSLSNIIEKQIL